MHFFRSVHFVWFFAFVWAGGLFAQTPSPSPGVGNPPSPAEGSTYWTADLPGGTYTVAHHLIASVGIHQYTLEGGATRVVEVSVDTLGSVQARFYALEVVNAVPSLPGASAVEYLQDKIREESDRLRSSATSEPWEKVLKTYPTTTHAHTIEYRLESAEQVQELYKNLRSSWMQRKNQIFRIKS